MLPYYPGWGTTSFGGSVSNVLMEVQVPVWAQNECEASYPDKVFSKMMCAAVKTGGKDSCQVRESKGKNSKSYLNVFVLNIYFRFLRHLLLVTIKCGRKCVYI